MSVKCTVQITYDLPVRHILPEKCMEDCIARSGPSYQSTQMVEEHWKKQRYTCCAKNRCSQRLLAVHGRKRPVDQLTVSSCHDGSHHGSRCFSPACSCGPENTGVQSPKRVLIHARLSSIENATTPFRKLSDQHEAHGRRFVLSVNENCFRRDCRCLCEFSRRV